MSKRTEAAAIVARLDAEYGRAAEALRLALKAFIHEGVEPNPDERANRNFAYPELRLAYRPTHRRSWREPTRDSASRASTARQSPGPTYSPSTSPSSSP
jgi:hypothetical protein